ncbi:MaoC family dehydratase N-terminal domain-containing protein [Alcaligenaceae bacterium]|nr:MaoC family dehydratase N-terminal domain-containing protein [Alcaligenaceae bacterium]
MVDASLVGRRVAQGTVDVEKGRLRFFAKAIGETDPVYVDKAAARAAGYRALPVPPTFLFCLNGEVCELGAMLNMLQMNLGRILHGEQAFDYHRMAYAGDTLHFDTHVVDVYEKKGGALYFVVQESRVTNQDGEHIADLRCTIVENRG